MSGGWHYPAGAEHDPRAHWNQKSARCEDCGDDAEDCICCGNCKNTADMCKCKTCDRCELRLDVKVGGYPECMCLDAEEAPEAFDGEPEPADDQGAQGDGFVPFEDFAMQRVGP